MPFTTPDFPGRSFTDIDELEKAKKQRGKIAAILHSRYGVAKVIHNSKVDVAGTSAWELKQK